MQTQLSSTLNVISRSSLMTSDVQQKLIARHVALLLYIARFC